MYLTFLAKRCKDPGTPRRGSKNGNLQVGQTLHFSCSPCYKLTGDSTRTCQADLTWTGSQPTCAGKFQLIVLSVTLMRKPRGQIYFRRGKPFNYNLEKDQGGRGWGQPMLQPRGTLYVQPRAVRDQGLIIFQQTRNKECLHSILHWA
jgi:hypothetical protein